MKCHKKLISFASLLSLTLAFSAQAFEKTMPVKYRDGKKLRVEERTLTDLESTEAFDGKYFKVVLGTELENAIRFDCADEEVLLRAATAYYNMSAMREYFLKSSLANKSTLQEKVTIRIDIEQIFNDALHFDARKELFKPNGTISYGPSDPFMLADLKDENGNFVFNADGSKKRIEPWGYETWYLKAKVAKRKSPFGMVTQSVNSRDFKNMLMGQLLYNDVINMTQSALLGYFDPISHLISMAFSVGISELIPQTLALAGRFMKQRYYLDSAMIPEISMHEYTHIALAPVFGMITSTALNEGYANYFAYKLSGLEKLGAHARKHNLSDVPKSAKNKGKYNMDLDTLRQAAWGSFTFALLYDLDQALGDEGEKILTYALSKMDADTRLRDNNGNNLIDAVKLSIKEISTHPKGQWRAVETVVLKRFPTPQQN